MLFKLVLLSCLILGIPLLLLTLVIWICDAELKKIEVPKSNTDPALTLKETDDKVL